MNELLFLIILSHGIFDSTSDILDDCKYKVEPIGCYAEYTEKRVLPVQVINERDPYSNVYNGRIINWKDYNNFLQGFICRCAGKAFSKGYRVIGIQFYGECWAGVEGHKNYSNYGVSTACRTGEYHNCKYDDKVCTGKDSVNYVYRIAPTECEDVYYEPVGCFSDKGNSPRPIPDYIQNERDYSISNWNGHLIDWRNWDTYSPKMICRCAKKANELRRKTFGVQFFGECWSGEENKTNYQKDGFSDRCIAAEFKSCPYNSYHCVGKDHVNGVYQIIQGPSVIENAAETQSSDIPSPAQRQG